MNKLISLFNNKAYLLLAIIILVSCILRFYKLTSIPVSLYWDEVSTGYNAYSIATNFKDEYGTFLPILFKAYNDYKMPANVYLTAASIKLFGLSEFGVRFPSALLGTLTVFITFLLVRLIFSVKDLKKPYLNPETVALLSCALLAISPWHIQFSRAGFEANIGLFFTVLGLYLFFKSFSKAFCIPISAISFVLAFYSYRSIFLFLPFLLLGLLTIYRKSILPRNLHWLIFGVAIFIVLLIPLYSPLTKEGSSRFAQTSIEHEVDRQSLKLFENGETVNRKLLYGKVFIEGYLSSFSPQFLFFSGDPNGRHSARGMGLLYLWEIPFILLGLYVLFRKVSRKIAATFTIWLIIFPVAAALSIPTPHALRTINALPLPQVITSLGVLYSIFLLRDKVRKTFVFTVLFVIVFSFLYFIKLYINSNTKLVVSDWGDGYKQLAKYAIENDRLYESVIITGHYWQPHMYMLFYTKYDPRLYQEVGSPEKFHKYYFGGTSWDLDVGRDELNNVDLKGISKGRSALVALSPEEFRDQEPNLKVIKKIYDHSGKLIFIMSILR